MINEHAKMISRIDSEIEVIAEKMREVWANNSRSGEYGDRELTPHGKRKMAVLVKEREKLEQSASAAYRI